MRHPGTELLGGILGLTDTLTVVSQGDVYIIVIEVYTPRMTKRLVDIDEDALDAARSQLGTTTIKATVNEALRLVSSERSEVVRDAMDVLADMPLSDRDDAWR
jgi:Arc/MetJ family transcription regulator